MKEVSLLSLLREQQEKNRQGYQALFSLLNLSRLNAYHRLPEATESSDKTLQAAFSFRYYPY